VCAQNLEKQATTLTVLVCESLSLVRALARSLSDVSHQDLLRALLTSAPNSVTNSCPPKSVFSIFNATFRADQCKPFWDYLELAMQSQYNKGTVWVCACLCVCVCVCVCVMRNICICILLALGVPEVCKSKRCSPLPNMFWKKVPGPWAKEFIFSEKQNCQGKYVYPSHTFLTKLVSRGSTSLLVLYQDTGTGFRRCL
jgi:hypothetical protein